MEKKSRTLVGVYLYFYIKKKKKYENIFKNLMGVGSINKKKSMRKLQIWGKYIDGPNDATIFFFGGFLFVLEKSCIELFFLLPSEYRILFY